MRRVLSVALIWAVAIIAILPTLVAIAPAFRAPSSEAWTSTSFAYVIETYGSSLKTSFMVAAGVVVGSLLIGVPAAFAFIRHRFPGSSFFERLVEVPLALPGVTIAIGLLLVYARFRSNLLLLCGGIMLYTIPYVVRIVGNAIDVTLLTELENAARTLGSSPSGALRRVTVPLLLQPMLLATLATFALAWGEFNVSFLLATPLQATFSSALHGTFTSNSPEVSGAAMLLFLAGAAPFLLAFQLLGKRMIVEGQRV